MAAQLCVQLAEIKCPALRHRRRHCHKLSAAVEQPPEVPPPSRWRRLVAQILRWIPARFRRAAARGGWTLLRYGCDRPHRDQATLLPRQR